MMYKIRVEASLSNKTRHFLFRMQTDATRWETKTSVWNHIRHDFRFRSRRDKKRKMKIEMCVCVRALKSFWFNVFSVVSFDLYPNSLVKKKLCAEFYHEQIRCGILVCMALVCACTHRPKIPFYLVHCFKFNQ